MRFPQSARAWNSQCQKKRMPPRATSVLSCLLHLLSSFALGSCIAAIAQPVPDLNHGADPQERELEFDVVSIRPTKETDPEEVGMTADGLQFTAPLKWFVSNAYGIRMDCITGGPKWIDSENFEIHAKVAPEDIPELQKLNRQQRFALLKSPLGDRFGLKIHIEQKVRPVYELVVSRSGSKLHRSIPAEGGATVHQDGTPVHGAVSLSDTDLKVWGADMGRLASLLTVTAADILGRPVVDKTGLAGFYDFELKWAPALSTGADERTSNQESSSSPLQRALDEQLGLSLKPARETLDELVVEDAHLPSPN
jgi:uncharacterized protein (TIGR03435 family)